MTNYDTEEYKGYTIEISYDPEPMNPRTEWDEATTMVCWHSRYNLGDMEHNGKRGRESRLTPISDNYQEPIDLLYELAGVDRNEYQDEQYEKTGSWDDMDTADLYKLIEEKGTIIRTLYLYDHSGITISMGGFSCPWDSGPVGYVYITKEKIVKEWGEGEDAYEKAEACMKAEVELYDNYLTGEVYSFKILNADEEEVDSCSGYYGDSGKEDMIKECKSLIDYYIQKKEEKDLLLGIQLELAL